MESEQVSLPEAYDRVNAEDIRSPIDLPGFDNSAMDGFAVDWQDCADASQERPVALQVVMDIPAGAVPTDELQRGQAARIMTGAPVPNGASAIVPVEATDANFARDGGAIGTVVRVYASASASQYIRPVGENIRRGELILAAGSLIQPAEIGMLAGYRLAPKLAMSSASPRVVIRQQRR